MKSITKVILNNSIRKEKQENIKEKILSVIAFLIVFISLTITMIITSVYVTTELKKINQEYAFINILLFMNFIILFGKSIFEGLNTLYFSKDTKILLRMPIKPKEIVNAKIINMILSEYQMEFIMLAIPMIVYGVLTNAQILFYIYMTITLIILPIIPIILISGIISIIMRFANKIKNKNKVIYITLIISIIALDIIFTGFNSQKNINISGFEQSILRINGIAEGISNQFVLIKPIMNTLLNYNNILGLKNLVLYVTESIVIYFLGIAIISKIYLKGAIGTTINSQKNEKEEIKLTLQDFKKKEKNKAYLSKELKVIIRTPIFCVQCVIIPIIYPLAISIIVAFALIISKIIGVNIISDLTPKLENSRMHAIFIAIGAVFFMMNFCSIIGISKENATAKLTKTIPISLKEQIYLKTLIGKIINTLSIIIITISYQIITQNIVATLEILTILILLNSIGEKIKLYIDSRKPQIHWENEYAMLKQNSNVMNVLFYTLIVLVVLFLIATVIKSPKIYLTVILAILIIINTIINYYIKQNNKKIFEKLY